MIRCEPAVTIHSRNYLTDACPNWLQRRTKCEAAMVTGLHCGQQLEREDCA